jgi:hypothetical protein
MLQRKVAREHRVSPMLVCRLLKKAQRVPRFIEELIEERNAQKARRLYFAAAIQGFNEKNVVLDSVAMVVKTLHLEHGIEAKEKEVSSIMRLDLGMRYKKIVAGSLHINSDRNLVLRQQFAI